jgi:hypothetical protein
MKAENLLRDWETIMFPRKALLHGIGWLAKDNIKVVLTNRYFECVVNSTEDRIQWRILLNTVINFRGS